MTAPHCHDDIEINFVVAGQMTHQSNNAGIETGKSDLAVFWAALPHQMTKAPPDTRYVCIYIPLDMFFGFAPGLRCISCCSRAHFWFSISPIVFAMPTFCRFSATPRLSCGARPDTEVKLRRFDLAE
jgi:AraC family transcriptional regulator, melibiose operon regulatory protein